MMSLIEKGRKGVVAYCRLLIYNERKKYARIQDNERGTFTERIKRSI